MKLVVKSQSNFRTVGSSQRGVKPLRATLTRASTSDESAVNVAPVLVGAASLPEWYARWGPHFEEVERGAARIDDLEIDLDDAIAEENYSAAARIKAEIEQLDGRDLFLTLEDAMEQAIAEERYEDAARIRDATMMNLVGWWRGRFETDTEGNPFEDPLGHLLRVDFAYGKILGKMYSVRDLAASRGYVENAHQAGLEPAAPMPLETMGIPMLEIFLRKGEDGQIECQPVFLTAATVDDTTAEAGGFLSDDEGGAVGELESTLDEAAGSAVSARESLLGPQWSRRPPPRGSLDTPSDDDTEDEDEDGEEEEEKLARAGMSAEMLERLEGAEQDMLEDEYDLYERQPAQLLVRSKHEFELTHPSRALTLLPEFIGLAGSSLGELESSAIVESLNQLYNLDIGPEVTVDDNETTAAADAATTPTTPPYPPLRSEGAAGPGPGSAGAQPPADPAAEHERAQFNVSLADEALEPARLQRLTEKDLRVNTNLSEEQMRALGLNQEDLRRLSQGIAEFTVKKVQDEVARVKRTGEAITKESLAKVIREAVEELLVPGTQEAPRAPARSPAPTLAGPSALSLTATEDELLSGSGASSSSVIEGSAATENGVTVPRKARYTRVLDASAPADVFSGLFLGSFGPHGPELLQLSRGADEEGEEQVMAVKLTGDPNVPTGAVSFKARIGRQYRLSPKGVYPDELGVIGRYKGQGRVAQYGYIDARWVDGELLIFSARGSDYTGEARLGFVWHVPGDRKFLILLNKISLAETELD